MDIIGREEQELQEALVEVRKKRIKRKIISIAVVASVVLAILILIYFYGYNAAKKKAATEISKLNTRIDELENIPVVVDPVTPEIVQKVISNKTTEISELATAEYTFTNAAKFTDTAHIVQIFDWMTKKSFVQKWDGKIKAGVNLDGIQVAVKDETITITMPKAEILSYEVDYDSVEVLDEKNNVFNPISVKDKTNFDAKTKDEMIARAIENGLLDKAQMYAENTISNLVTVFVKNIQKYKIEFVTLEE